MPLTWHAALAPSNQEGSVSCGGGLSYEDARPVPEVPSPSCLSKTCAARPSHRSRIFRTAGANKSLADHSKTWVGRSEYHQRTSKRLFRSSMLAPPIRRQVENVQALCDARISQTPARARPAGPFCTKCSSKTKKMKRSHVTLHRRASISFERHTFVCTGCGHSRSYTLENASRSTSSNRWRNDVGNF
jgi:hypothetical protein